MAKGKKRGSGAPPAVDGKHKTGAGAKADDFSLEAQSVPADALKPKPTQTALRLQGAAPRATRGGAREDARVLSYRHQDKRKNNPQVGLVNEANDPQQPKTEWHYDPHIDPALQFDVGRAQIEKLIDDALASGDQAAMRAALEELKRAGSPHLNWTGKAERTSFDIDTVSLHVHERIDPMSILAAVSKRIKEAKSGKGALGPDMQMGLFSAPFENLPLRDAIDFYKHERGWANRLIAGAGRCVGVHAGIAAGIRPDRVGAALDVQALEAVEHQNGIRLGRGRRFSTGKAPWNPLYIRLSGFRQCHKS